MTRGKDEEWSSIDNHTYMVSRIPLAFSAEDMPMSQLMLQHVRNGFGPEEQLEMLAPSGINHEPGSRMANFGFLPRTRFRDHLGAVGGVEHMSGTARDMMGVRNAVREVMAVVHRVARGAAQGFPFYFRPGRHYGVEARTLSENKTRPRGTAEGNELQPPPIDMEYRGDIRGASTGRRSSGGASAEHRYVAFPGLDPLPTFSPVPKISDGPPPELVYEDADEVTALLHECLRGVQKEAPASGMVYVAISDIVAMVRKKAIATADQLLRNELSWNRWRINNSFAVANGTNFLPSGQRCEPSELMIMKVYNEILEDMKSIKIETLDGPTGSAGCAALY